MVELYYCADGNERLARIAVRAGFKYGAQLPRKIYLDPDFVDQKWRKPNFKRYMAALAHYKPTSASVLNWERWQGNLVGGVRFPVRLCGSPEKQMALSGLKPLAFGEDVPKLNVVSADCNYHLKMTTKFNQFWRPGDAW